jgi:hypothetical protein
MRWTHEVITKADYDDILPLASVKADLDVTFDDDDAIITAHRDAAIDWVQDYTNRFLGPTVVKVYFDQIASRVDLPFSPISAITAMTVAGAPVIGYRSTPGEHWSVFPASGQRWPSYTIEPGAAQITYSVGHAAGEAPAAALQAVRLITAIFYDKPSDPEKEWESARNLLNGIRVRSIG